MLCDSSETVDEEDGEKEGRQGYLWLLDTRTINLWNARSGGEVTGMLGWPVTISFYVTLFD